MRCIIVTMCAKRAVNLRVLYLFSLKEGGHGPPMPPPHLGSAPGLLAQQCKLNNDYNESDYPPPPAEVCPFTWLTPNKLILVFTVVARLNATQTYSKAVFFTIAQ